MLEKEAEKQNMDTAAMFKSDRIADISKKANFVSAEDMYVALAEGAITAIGIINRIKDDNALRKALFLEPEQQAVSKTAASTMKLRPFSNENATHDKGVWVKGEADLMVRIANCCRPLPGDEIIGYITRGRGVSVHKVDCPNMNYYRRHESERGCTMG